MTIQLTLESEVQSGMFTLLNLNDIWNNDATPFSRVEGYKQIYFTADIKNLLRFGILTSAGNTNKSLLRLGRCSSLISRLGFRQSGRRCEGRRRRRYNGSGSRCRCNNSCHRRRGWRRGWRRRWRRCLLAAPVEQEIGRLRERESIKNALC